MWSSLPSNLRAVLGTALLLGIGVAAAAFALSFFALREAAQNPALKFGAGHAWLFPLGIDMALIFFEVLLVGASMVRVRNKRGELETYPRAIPFGLVLLAAAGTLYFNGARVPAPVRPIALAVPVASILVTLGLAYLLKMLAAASGVEAIHLAPPPVDPRPIVRSTDVLHADAVRVPAGEMQHVTSLEMGRTGQRGSGGEESKKRLILGMADELGPEYIQQYGSRGVTAALTEQGVDVTESYVHRVLNTAGRSGRNGHRQP